MNIEHGLFEHEEELKQLITSNDIDIIFLTERDNKHLDESYKILNYKAVLPVMDDQKEKSANCSTY